MTNDSFKNLDFKFRFQTNKNIRFKDEYTVVYIGKGVSKIDYGTVQTEKEITNTRPIFYFEVLIKNDGKEGDIIIGIGEKDITEKCLSLGSTSRSYGYHSKGKSHNNKKVNKYGENFVKDDIIGCGVDLENKSIFYTKNGKFLGYAFKDINFEIGKGYLYPSVCMHTLNSEIFINFGKENFKFDIKGYYENNLGKKYSELQKINPKFDDMDSLVKEYLFHEGYLQTLKSMIPKDNQEIQEKKDNILNDNINIKPNSEKNDDLYLDIENNMKIDEIENNENKIIIEDNKNESMDIEEEYNYEKDENLIENIFKLLVKNNVEEKKENDNKNKEKEKIEDKKEEKKEIEKNEEKKEEKKEDKKEEKKEIEKKEEKEKEKKEEKESEKKGEKLDEKNEEMKGTIKIEIVKKKNEIEKEKEKENRDIKDNLKKFISFRNKIMDYFSNNEFNKAISLLEKQEMKGKEELKKKLYFTIMIMKYFTLLKNDNYIECFELLDSFEKEYWDKYKILLFENGSFNETKLYSVQNLATLVSQPDIMNSTDAFFLNEKQINLIQNQINSLLFEMFNFSSMSNLGKIIAHLEYMNGLYLKIFNCNQELSLKLD